MSKEETTINGVLLIDKPAGITSHDVIDQVRKLTGIRQVGHAGTLDPFATGLLIVAVGKATRLLEYTRGLPKTYHAEITLGATSDTDDRTGTITPYSNKTQIDRGVIEETLTTFIGPQKQIPPIYAAIKIKGKKLYEYARAKEEVTAKPRSIQIHDIRLISYKYPNITIDTTVSSGTYIRSLARDIGEALQTGAYTKELRRTAIGTYTEQKSNAIKELEKTDTTAHLLLPQVLVEHLPTITLHTDNVAKFINGQAIEVPNMAPSSKAPIAIFDETKKLIGIASYDSTSSLLHPTKVLVQG